MKNPIYRKVLIMSNPFAYYMIDEQADELVSVHLMQGSIPSIEFNKWYSIEPLNPIECSKEEFQLAYNNALEKLIEYGSQID
jgi:hypothetical protein